MRAPITIVILGVLVALCSPLHHNVVFSQGIEATSKPFEGVEINILTMQGGLIFEPLQRRGLEFTNISGAAVNVTGVPLENLHQAILTDLGGANQYDAYVFIPQWLVDYIETGNLEDLTARVQADAALEWDDVAPFFRDYHTTYDGHIYTIPLDGDFMMVYYREDLLAKAGRRPPATWQAYLTTAEAFHSQDLNEDGTPDFGSCIPKVQNTLYWFFFAIATPYLQSLGTAQGAFFNIQTMDPLVNNRALAAALDILQGTGQFGPPNELALNVGDTRELFVSGRCALAIDWGDIGVLAIGRYVQDKIGATLLPGSGQVLDRNTGQLVACNTQICPYAVNGINRAPYAATGGWSGALNATANPKVKDAAYEFLSYVSQPAQSGWDVTQGTTGFNPYRISHFENLQPWLEAGMSQALANNYLSAIEQNLGSANMVLDLRLPGTQDYQEAVNQAVHDFLSGSNGQATEQPLHSSTDAITICMQQIHQSWDQITNSFGRSAQLERYRKCLKGIGLDLYLPVIRKQTYA